MADRIAWVTCSDCGKRGYECRADAKRARQRTAGHQAVYQCSSGLWHHGQRVPGRPRDHYPGRFGRPPLSTYRPMRGQIDG